ncbi:MAG: hypothetical protein ACO3DI_06565 [Ilumatobacteraceae bacterium]
MAYPTTIVEIAFDDGPYVVSPTWTDVTAYCRGFATSRGVPDDWTLVADGSATVTLSNRDRRFDPFYTSGPYYGKLLPRRQIRIRATYGATTYDVFRGFIAGWPPQWTDAGYDSTVELSCFDALQLLASSSMPADWARPYILSLSPRHYWEMDDPVRLYQSNMVLEDAGSAVSQVNAYSAYVYQGSQIAAGLPSHSIGTDFVLGMSQLLTTITPSVSSSFTIAYWTQATVNSALTSYIQADCFGHTIEMYFDGGTSGSTYGRFTATAQNAGGKGTWHSTINYDPVEPHHIAFTHNTATGAGKLYIDGFDVTSAKTSSGGSAANAWENFTFDRGQFQQIVMFPSVLTQAQVQEIVRLGEAQYPETSSARVTRIIGNTPYSSSLVSTPGSPASDVLDLTPNAPTATAELTLVAQSEYAPLFVNKAGTLTLYNQSQIRTQTKSITSQQTYGAGGLSLGTQIQLQYDGDSMRNIANVQLSADGVYIDENSTSVTAYAEAEQFVETQVATYADAEAIGDIVTGWGGQVYAKASPVDVVLDPSASWASTLDLELFERVTVAVAPKTGNTITLPMLVSRISHQVTPERWSTSLEGSARWAAVFILNKSTLGGTDLLG